MDPRFASFTKHSLLECEDDELPYGWEKVNGGVYYVNHVNRSAQYHKPVIEAKRNYLESHPPQGEYQSEAPPPFIQTAAALEKQREDYPTQGYQANPQEIEANLQGDVGIVLLTKNPTGFGFTIVGGDRPGELLQIRNIVRGGVADRDGRLKVGDVLVRVNGESVVTYSHYKVVELFRSIPLHSDVELEIRRGYPLPRDEVMVNIVKGPLGFGFSLRETHQGPTVKQIMDIPRCAQLRVNDLIVEVNGEKVTNYSHNDFVGLLKRYPNGNKARFLVIPSTHPNDDEVFQQMEVRLMRQESGFGFRIIGGKEEGTQATVGEIKSGGAADLDGRLQIGDEITHINNYSVFDAAHREVIQLVREAGAIGEITLGIRRKTPQPSSKSSFFSDDNMANEAIKAFNHWVTMRLSKFRIIGAPGSGKTSVLDLTMGKPPATERESTKCMEPPTRMVVSEPPSARKVTIAPILAHEMVWEIVTRDRMYEMVGKYLKAAIDLLESQDVSPKALPSPPREFEEAAKPDADVHSASNTDMAHEMIHSTQKEQKSLKVITAMFDQLEKMEGSMELMDVHWVFTQDTGGQPCYQSVAPLLLRENSCSVITTKLNEEFESKPEFAFFIRGKPIKMSSTKIQLTNLQMIETLVKSQASITPSLSSSKAPKYIIVGTFEDEADKCGEKVKTKNAILKERLNGLEDQRIDNGDSIIFPIYAVNPNVEERRKSAAWLRRKILESPGATVSERVNIRWFGLLLHLITEEKDVYTLDECLEAGKTLRMNEDEIFQALKFFHGLGIIIHFRTEDLEGAVVVKVEVIFSTLSLLLGISFIDRDTLDHEFKLNLMPKTQERLQLYGRFNKELLLQPQFKFSDVFTAKYFLDLLEHVTAIAAVGENEYFLPSALAFATDEEIKLRVKGEPWIIRLTREEESSEPVDIPPPLAYLPSLVINVLKSSSAKLPSSKSRFSQQYSNALSLSYSGGVLHFIQRVHQIEVYFSLCKDQPHKCHAIRSVVLAATETTEEKLNIPPGVLIKNNTFLCPCEEGSSGHICTYNSVMKKAQCEKSEEYYELTPSQQRWLDGAQAGDSDLSSQETTSVSVFKPVTLSPPAAQRGERKQEVYDPQILTSEDLLDVLERLETLSQKKFWKLGLKLGLKSSTLDKLKDSCTSHDFGQSVMKAWLNQEDNVKELSWKSLVEALESNYVMERPTAQNVRDWLKSR